MQRIAERRRRVRGECHTLQILSAHHLPHSLLSSGLYPFLLLTPLLLRPGLSDRGHGRSAGLPSEPVPPWIPLPLIAVPHRRDVTRLLWRISRRHYFWRRIRRGLGRGPRGTNVYSLAVLPARLACADAHFRHFVSGLATALFFRGGQYLRCAIFQGSCLFLSLSILQIR